MGCEEPYTHWIDDLFGQCIHGTRETVGFWMGLLATAIWMYAQIPQIVTNFKLRSTDGLSLGFLALLSCADLASLIGAILNRGLRTQIISAAWFVLDDTICALQCLYYRVIEPKCIQRDENDFTPGVHQGVTLPFLVAAAAASTSATEPHHPYTGSSLFGTILGWISACCYVVSRLPQIVKNFKRKKTEGLSLQFFFCALIANSSYAISIFLADTRWEWIWSQFPWLIGSAGIIPFDFLVVIQGIMYSEPEQEEQPTEEHPPVQDAL